jgi:phosphohistidine phosphatase SixA/8-oxo-dGTP pyrophosphatase MutT (NUDIX family)
MAPESPDDVRDPDVLAAGAVVVRKGKVLLVHRPKYDDWSFPKGKQDPGEHEVTTAVREVLEETGVEIRLGMPMPPMAYVQFDGRAKLVRFWRGHVVGDHDVSSYAPNAEVDQVAWVPRDETGDLLTYERDSSLLASLEETRSSTPLVLLRHAKALSRKKWSGDDPERPLNDEGQAQAAAVSPVLAAYGVTRVVTSSSTRCVQTVQPYVDEHVLTPSHTVALSEEHVDRHAVHRLLDDLMEDPEPTVLCTHRPVLPVLLEHLGIDIPELDPAALLVVHHRRRTILAVELHEV